MKNNYRFEHVGSLLRTDILKTAKNDFNMGKISFSEYKSIERKEIEKIVIKQYNIGLKTISDGEYNREYWHYDFISKLNGIYNYVLDVSGKFHGSMSKLKSYYVKSKLSFDYNHSFLDDFKYLKSLCDKLSDDLVPKITIPGPNMIYYSGVINNPLYYENTEYKNLNDVKIDIIKVYNDAIKAFYDAGCRYLQLDDTAWGALFSEDSRNEMKKRNINPDELLKDFSYLTIESIKNKPNDMIIATHCCRGNFKSNWLYEGDYSYVSSEMFKAKFDRFFLEFDTDRAGSFEYIKNIDTNIVLGLITTKNGVLENKNFIGERIKEAQKYISKDRIYLSPQCGFASTEDGNNITEEEQWEKLKLVIDIANEYL